MEKYYNIVLLDNLDFCLCACPTLEIAKKRLKEIKETDKKLQKFYNWKNLPKYAIVEGAKM